MTKEPELAYPYFSVTWQNIRLCNDLKNTIKMYHVLFLAVLTELFQHKPIWPNVTGRNINILKSYAQIFMLELY